jgi:hypothetical protein
MNYQLIRLDTWLRTYALNPKGFEHWKKVAENSHLRDSGVLTFTLKPDENTTGIEQTIELETI